MPKTFAFFSLILAFIALGSAVSVHDGPFELDGNAVSDGGMDWETLYNGASGNMLYTGINNDPAPLSIFRTGGSKDTNDVPSWRQGDGSVPDKNDLSNTYAASIAVNGNLILYFGADRFSNDGDSAIGFWFFQDQVSPSSGAFNGQHQNGDMFVVADFGSNSEVSVYLWNNGNLDQVTTTAVCDPNVVQSVCVIANDVDTNAPWPYTPKSGTNGVFPSGSFVEGAVNLNDIFNTGTVPCFTSFLAESRSSTSLTAQLKDFVLGSFELCGVSINVDCTNTVTDPTNTFFIHSYDINVTNTGFGLLYDLDVALDDITVATYDDLNGGQTVTYSGTFNSNSGSASVGVASVEAALVDGSASVNELIDDYDGPDTCPPFYPPTGIDVQVSCTNARINSDQTAFLYDYTVDLTNTGFGVVNVSDVVLTIAGDLVNWVTLNPSPASNTAQYTGTVSSASQVTSLSVSTSGTDYTGATVSDSDVSGSCGTLNPVVSMTVNKTCDVSLDETECGLTVLVSYSGVVCNNGDLHLNSVSVVDDAGTIDVSDDIVTNIGTLLAGQCAGYTGAYYPGTELVTYSDNVDASGTAVLGFGDVQTAASAVCALCV